MDIPSTVCRYSTSMPYFVASNGTIQVLPPGRQTPPGYHLIDSEVAVACELTQDQPVTQGAAEALIQGRVDVFRSLRGPSSDVIGAESFSVSPDLPPRGHWQYLVRPMTELGGFATAKGTAARMEDVLNGLARAGWELVTTSERDARWMVGETIILVLRRYVEPERAFEERFEAEERIRRAVLLRLSESPESATQPLEESPRR